MDRTGMGEDILIGKINSGAAYDRLNQGVNGADVLGRADRLELSDQMVAGFDIMAEKQNTHAKPVVDMEVEAILGKNVDYMDKENCWEKIDLIATIELENNASQANLNLSKVPVLVS